MNFNELITPIHPEEFFSQYWEKKPLVLDRTGVSYAGLFSLPDFDMLVSTLSAPLSPLIKFVNNKKELRNEEFLDKKSPHLLDKKKVMQGFYRGNTIVLNSLHHRFDPIRKFCYELEEVFGHNVSANSYLTPANAQGFQAHFDSHDVLILQIDGVKRWKIYEQYVKFPLTTKDTPYFQPLDQPAIEVVLKPGDLLYIPRGVVHEALTENSHSLHLTIGIQVFTWVDLIKEIAIQEETLRKALPIRMLSKDQEVDVGHLKVSNDPALISKAIEKLRERFSDQRIPSFYGGISTLKTTQNITPSTCFKKADLKYSLSTQDGQVTLQFGENRFRAPASAELFLDHIISSSHFSIETLPSYLDFLSTSSKLAIVNSLVKSGMLLELNVEL